MELFHHITVLCISEQEAKSFSEVGVEFKEVIRGTGGESSVIFEIGEKDPRWSGVATLLKSLEGNDRVSKEHRVQDLSVTAPTMEAVLQLRRWREVERLRFLTPHGAPARGPFGKLGRLATSDRACPERSREDAGATVKRFLLTCGRRLGRRYH